jgi:putative endonuclease
VIARGLLARLTGWLSGSARGRAPADELGRAGEHAAAEHLTAAGYRVLGRNVRVPMGEADLVCLAPDGRTRVIVEVKSRRVSTAERKHIPAEAAVNTRKRAKLLAIAAHLKRVNGWNDQPIRIDVIAVDFDADTTTATAAPARVRHFINAVGA